MVCSTLISLCGSSFRLLPKNRLSFRSPLAILPLIHPPSYFLTTGALTSIAPPSISPQVPGLYSQFLPGHLNRMSCCTSVLSVHHRGPVFCILANDAISSYSLKFKIWGHDLRLPLLILPLLGPVHHHYSCFFSRRILLILSFFFFFYFHCQTFILCLYALTVCLISLYFNLLLTPVLFLPRVQPVIFIKHITSLI